MVERGYCIYSISLNIFNLLFTLKQLQMLFSYHLLYFCTALSLIIMLSSHYHHHKSKTFSQLTQCPFTGTLLLFRNWSCVHLSTFSFSDFNLKTLPLINFKLDRVEGSTIEISSTVMLYTSSTDFTTRLLGSMTPVSC